MKKLLSLLTLLLLGMGSAWAGDVNTTLIDGISLPSLPTGTYTGGTEIIHKGSNKAVVLDNNGNSVMQASAPGYGTPTGDFSWANAYDGDNDGGWSTTGTSWDAPSGSVFVGSGAYNNSSSAHNVAFARRCNLRTIRTFAYRFTKCGGVSALVKSQGNTDAAAACMAVYEVSASNGLTHIKTVSSKTKATDIITVDDLASAKTYVAYIYGMNGSNGELYEVAFLAPSENDPKLSASPNDITLKATEQGVSVSKKFTITGSNLTPETYNLNIPTVTGLSVSPTSFTVGSDGTVNQEVTVSYSSTVNVPANTANITASVDGLALNVAVNYSASVVSWTLQSVSSETTWDWSKVTANSSSSLYADNGIKLTAESTPSLTTEFVMANYDGDLYTIGEGFDGTSIAFKGQYPTRRNEFCQNGTIKFNTTVPGTVEVKFSDTGSTASATAVKRYLVVNGNQTEFWASRANNSTEEGVAYEARANVVAKVPVPAGDVTITGTSAHIYNYVKFIPAAETTINLNAKGYATYSSHYDVTVSGAKAYTAALDVAAETITCTEIADGKVPAGAGVLLFGEANATVTLTPTTGVAALTGNDLKGTTKADGTLATVTDGANAYALSGDTFKKFTGTALTANKAYFEVTGSAPARLSIIFDEETTGIENANLNANLNDEVFDLQGRRVAQPTKGLYIVNGRKVIVR